MQNENNTPSKRTILYTCPDGQVFGIEREQDQFRSVVPSDLADKGEGYMHATTEDAYEYLLGLMYKNMTDADVMRRFNTAIENAEGAFWGVIADSFPEIKSGDLGPDVIIPFKIMMEQAVAVWLKGNSTSEEDVVHLVPDNFLEKDASKAVPNLPFPNQNEVKRMKETYPVGTRVRVDKMDDPHSVPVGTYGTVKSVDDAGQLHVNWDNGSTLALIPNADKFTVLTISLEDFVASKIFTDDIEAVTGSDNGYPDTKGYVYMGSFYIEQLEDGSYYFPINRNEYASENLEELEKILYDQHFWL